MVSGTRVKLYPGLCLYKAGTEDKWAGSGAAEWINSNDIVKRQIEYAFEKSCGGVILYSYNYLFVPDFMTSAVKNEIGNIKTVLAS